MTPLTTDNLKDILKQNNESLLKISRNDLKQALKENNEINNKVLFKHIDKIVNDRLTEFSDVILETIDTNRDETNQKFEMVNQNVTNLSSDVKDIKQDIKFVRQDIKDLGDELSNRPSRSQFEELKTKFDNYLTV